MSKSQKELPIEQSLFRFIVDYASDAIIPIDTSGKIVFWNKAAEKIFEYTADEIIGEPITKIMPTNIETSTDNSTSPPEIALGRNIETIGITKSGRTFPVEFSYSAWNTEQGIFLTVIARDITEKKTS